MPITIETILEANRKMLGKTNRAILFATVNLDPFLNPDSPEEDRVRTPSLRELLALVNDLPEEEFVSEVRDKLLVRSFSDFITKFQPGFHYRVAPPKIDIDYRSLMSSDHVDESLDHNVAGGKENNSDGGEEYVDNLENASDRLMPPPEVEFSLEGGPGWKKVSITQNHPYVRCLSQVIKQRLSRLDLDASLFSYKPQEQRDQLRKLAEEVQVANDRLLLEAKKNPSSIHTKRALMAYDNAANKFQAALENIMRVLPAIVYGLEQTACELRQLAPGGSRSDANIYHIEFGKSRTLISTPRPLPELPTDLKHPAVTDRNLSTQGVPQDKGNAISPRSLGNALDILREERQKYANTDIATVPQERRFPLVVSKFIDEMISNNLIAPLMGNLVATILQNPKELSLLNPDIKEVEYYHDMFLSVYSNAVENFLKTVTPLFETIMGVYLLFNEFPDDVRIPEDFRPELIIANDDLLTLIETRKSELKTYFDISCGQATNQFRDAISFALVPRAATFQGMDEPNEGRRPFSLLDDDMLENIRAIQEDNTDVIGNFTGSVYLDEMLYLMKCGYNYGFQILYSPQGYVRTGHINVQNIIDSFAIDDVIEHDFADSMILCLPDFTIMPANGKLITGKTADGHREVGVDVPELTVASSFVAAGRLMANDIPEFLENKYVCYYKGEHPLLVNQELPGIGIDLSLHPYLGETNFPSSHFMRDSTLQELLRQDRPFLVFAYVAEHSPFLSSARTMRRMNLGDGNDVYRHVHLFRQEVYLSRLLRSAFALGFGGVWPANDSEAEALLAGHITFIIENTGWYAPEQFLNSFPSELVRGKEVDVRREKGSTFRITLRFENGMSSDYISTF